jgi:hypothetical protein
VSPRFADVAGDGEGAMIRGSCFCGGIRFEADRVPLITTCHCSKCRKSRAAAFSVTACVPLGEFRYLQGENLIHTYEPPGGGYAPSFCRVCGSSTPLRDEARDLVLVPAGLLDDDPGARPSLHMFVGSKAPWWEITDEAPRFDKWVPGYEPADA